MLRKEMGDLVLAIRTAFSSAFRSSVSVNRRESNVYLGGCHNALTRSMLPYRGLARRKLTDL